MNLNLTLLAAVLCAAPLAAQQETFVTTKSGLDKVELGGALRFRAENRNPSLPVEGASKDSTYSGHARLHLGVNASDDLSAFIEFQKVVNGQGTSSVDSLRAAWLRWSGLMSNTDFKIGRFQMKYGNQRMISDLAWHNTGRAWDGAVISHKMNSFKADLFWTEPVLGDDGFAFPGVTAGATGVAFGGAYLEFDAGEMDIDVYALLRREQGIGALGTRDMTFGALLEGDVSEGLSYSVEAALQQGEHGALDAAGNAFALRLDWKAIDDLTLGVGFEQASGDGNATDGDDDAFKPLYDFAHSYHGNQDIFLSWTNLQDIVFRSAYNLDGNWKLLGDFHIFSLADADGAMPNANLTKVAGQDELGTEIDLSVKGELATNTNLWAGVSFFSAGDAIALGDDQIWLFMNLSFWF
ncbi:MAG: alginate export family protein [Planctomycetota bacterium]|jgi:hypothetical protein|nr:alginate export family protein [Planctomycetota bacterium]